MERPGTQSTELTGTTMVGSSMVAGAGSTYDATLAGSDMALQSASSTIYLDRSSTAKEKLQRMSPAELAALSSVDLRIPPDGSWDHDTLWEWHDVLKLLAKAATSLQQVKVYFDAEEESSIKELWGFERVIIQKLASIKTKVIEISGYYAKEAVPYLQSQGHQVVVNDKDCGDGYHERLGSLQRQGKDLKLDKSRLQRLLGL